MLVMSSESVDHHKVSQCVDALCKNGCEAVRASIRALEVEGSDPLTANLSAAERRAVLAELKSIMAVYDAR